MTKLAYALAFAAATTALTATSADAQGKGRNTNGVPPGHRPPAGMCRVWIDGVPPGQQAAPTDCATAEANRPSNGRVIYGDAVDSRKGKAKGKDKNKKDGDRDGRRDRDDDDRRGDRRDDDDDRRDRDRRDSVCLDRNRDGLCDSTADRPRGDRCVDRDGDGRCDATLPAGGYPSRLPEMIRVTQLNQGTKSAEALIWLRSTAPGNITPRAVDADNNDIPERITWVDGANQIVQIWTDRNRDGRADQVQIYENGRRVRTITG